MNDRKKRELDVIPGTNIVQFHHDPDDDDNLNHRIAVAMFALIELNTGQDRRNVHQRLTAYRKHSETLMEYVDTLQDLKKGLMRENAMLRGDQPEQSRRRWTEEQDNTLVEWACREDSTMVELALAFNRTPAAISSRLTYLVGVSKVSRHVVGRITGYLDGEPVSGTFDGELRSSQ